MNLAAAYSISCVIVINMQIRKKKKPKPQTLCAKATSFFQNFNDISGFTTIVPRCLPMHKDINIQIN